MKKSSINFKPVLKNSEVHNKREQVPDYVISDVKEKNIYVVHDTIENRRNEIEELYHKLVRQKIQVKMTPIREAVIVLDKPCFLNSEGKYTFVEAQSKIEKLADALESKYGIQCFQYHVHLDEGGSAEKRKNKVFIPVWERNLHAHLVFDWQDKKSGRMIALGKKHMAEIQTLTAEILGLQRGAFFSKAERLEHYDYRKKMDELEENYERILKEKTELLTAQIKQFGEELEGKKQKSAELMLKLQNLPTKLEIEELRMKEQALKTRLKDLNLQLTIQATEKAIRGLQAKKSDLETTLKDLFEKQKQQLKQYRQMKMSLEALPTKSEIEKLQTKENGLKTQLESLNLQLATQAVQKSIESLQAKNSNLKMTFDESLNGYNSLIRQLEISNPKMKEFITNQSNTLRQQFKEN